MAGAEQGRPNKAANAAPSACRASCPSWPALLFPFSLTQWKGNLLGKFLHGRESVGVSTVAAYLTFGEQLVRIMICSEQSHWSPVYVWAEGLQLIAIRVVIALTLFIQVNIEGGSQGGRDQRPWGEGAM